MASLKWHMSKHWLDWTIGIKIKTQSSWGQCVVYLLIMVIHNGKVHLPRCSLICRPQRTGGLPRPSFEGSSQVGGRRRTIQPNLNIWQRTVFGKGRGTIQIQRLEFIYLKAFNKGSLAWSFCLGGWRHFQHLARDSGQWASPDRFKWSPSP